MDKKDIKTFKDLAKCLGVDPNTVTNWVTRGEVPRGSSRLAIANALNVSTEWLRTGAGEMEPAYVLVPPMKSPFPSTPTVGLPYISSAWLHLSSVIETRGLKLSPKEQSQIILRASLSGMELDQEPTLNDVLDALSVVLKGE